jgi:alkaline phosphatase D
MTTRRQFSRAAASFVLAPAFIRHVLAADENRFALGIASGHPARDGMVLWTRLTGPGLPERVEVHWELAHEEAFTRIAARGTETAEAAWAHSVHAEPRGLDAARGYWYRFRALGQQSPAGRTRTAPAADAAAVPLQFMIASCQRWDHGFYAAWRHAATEPLDLVLFLGDYIYESASQPGRVRLHEGGPLKTLADYRQRYAQYKSDPALQAAHAACPWLMVWDDHEVENDYAGLQGQNLQRGFAAQRAAAYQAYWEHLPFPKSARPKGPDMRITGRLDWGRLARIHLLDDRQYRDPQACPRTGRGGSNTVRLAECAALADPARSLLGREQERWLADGWDTQRPWNLVAQQTLMARFSWRDPKTDLTSWTDGWDGYAPARRRLLDGVAAKKLPGVVVLGGAHTHYVADLKVDFDDPQGPVVASEFCGTSITSEGLAQSRLEAALPFNPHIQYGRGERRGYMRFTLDDQRLQATLMNVDDPLDAASPVQAAAAFVVEAGRPGPQRA